MRDVLRDFPSYTWVCKLNENRYFSGSLGTAPNGCFHVYTFQYKMWKTETSEEVDGVKKTEKFLHVSCCIKPPVNSGEEISCMEEETYPLSEKSLSEVRQWLLERINRYDYIGKSEK